PGPDRDRRRRGDRGAEGNPEGPGLSGGAGLLVRQADAAAGAAGVDGRAGHGGLRHLASRLNLPTRPGAAAAQPRRSPSPARLPAATHWSQVAGPAAPMTGPAPGRGPRWPGWRHRSREASVLPAG